MMVGAKDHGEMKHRERKKSDRQMASQDDIDTETTPESVTGGTENTEIHPEKAHGNGKDGGRRSPNTTTGSLTEETMTARDTGGGERKTTMMMVGEGRSARVEADLLGVARISTRSKKL